MLFLSSLADCVDLTRQFMNMCLHRRRFYDVIRVSTAFNLTPDTWLDCCSSSKASKSFTTYSIQLASDTPQDNAMLLRSSAALLWFGHHSYLERLYRPITQTVLLYCTSETTIESCVLYVIAALTGRKTSTKTFIKQTKCFLFDCRGACDFNWRLIKCLN